MVFAALALYFLAMVAIAAVLLLPSVRERCVAAARAQWRRLTAGATMVGARSAGTLRESVDSAASNASAFKQFVVRRRALLLGALGVLSVPPMLALALRERQSFEFDDDTVREPDPHISALLNGERLIPPPPLPPEVFTTREVELIRPAIRDASRDWNLLDADFRQRLLLVYKIMRDEHGYEMALLEGYRSPERQEKLAAMGSNVTQATAFQSYHQYGLAADSAFFRDGKLVISEKDAWAMRGYALYGQAAESVGLVWGGRWKMMDLGHVELRRRGVLGKRPG
ncbi:M15 family metallopeptidase [Ralstonia pseudosolanacearum]|uniref:M15 family metallopeptidase n=1 Tax=Ralstonia pseudosolanacearum TaxID=1310165 RepID=UPI001FFA4BFB|nr:M15 family metallopeptidase [Ralstonia pseudosolanacearum]MDO3506485.1 M15 family metallopeptidase [Ralstonia pseudosolanacearum]MDO3510704.1 M15 family metallopeptidase [Ralstonia pseudosolanacearum]MDO3537362.1 M15 family metallopeptidase [Ralstonia pseudosolanacearum]MDO3605439.1 M15 family metallopeptidase [Ralstonia pseudosolanacearum]MDO3611207.1 M15 family metallopeptidase [Ralstonia pseudosolanacearum]